MIQITYKQLNDQAFNNVLKKLGSKPFRDQKLAYAIAKIVRKIAKESETAQELFSKLIDTYADKDEQGKLIPYNGMASSFQVTKNQEEYRKALLDYEGLSFEIPVDKLTFQQLESVELSAEDCLALELIVEGEPA